MSLTGKLVSQIDVVSSSDVFFDTFGNRLYELASEFPDIIQSVGLLEGAWGTLGCVIYANYTHEGTKKVAKAIVEAVDENKKSITYRVIEGDLMELYSTISITVQVDTLDGKNFVTWTMEYLKLTPITPDPNSLMDLAITLTKGIDGQSLS